MDYLKFISPIADCQSLAIRTADYLTQQLQSKQFVLCKHIPSSNPILVLINQIDNFNLELWQKSIGTVPFQLQPEVFFEHQDLYYFFPDSDFHREEFYFFLFSEHPSASVLEILKQWSYSGKLLKNSILKNSLQIQTDQANLISQLLHDIQAIINLHPQDTLSAGLSDRLEYQQKVNANLLFYIRPVELLTGKMPITDLIKSSLQIIGMDINNFSLTVSTNMDDIEVDAELFSRAFNEVILNACEANVKSSNKCELSIKQIPGMSPFLATNLFEISICDNGPGISSDYLPSVWQPFFTTKKSVGHSGFGLTIVEKIIKAHQGFVEIYSQRGQGTQVKIYIPVL